MFTKRRLFRFLLFSAILAWFGKDGASGQVTQIAPDCQIRFSIDVTTAPARVPSTGFSNKTRQCGTWILSYQGPATVTGISLRLDSATDTAGAPGAWGAFSGTTVTGANPIITTPNSFFVGQGNPAWVSVDLVSAVGTGTITGYAYGWVIPPQIYASTTVVIPANQSVNVAQVNGHTTQEGGTNGSLAVGGQAAAGAAVAGNPNLIAGKDGSGNVQDFATDTQGNNYSFLACPNTADVALSGTNYTEIVAGTAAQVIRVCKVFVTSVSAGAPVVNTITVASATVTTCAGPTELFLGGGITGMDTDWGGALRSASGASICVKESVGNSDKVTISYAKF